MTYTDIWNEAYDILEEKGERVRINKRQMQQLLKEHDYFKMAYTEI